MIEWFHPGILLIVGAVLVPFLGNRTRKVFLLALPTVALVLCATTSPGTYGQVQFLGLDLTFGRVDKLSLVFAYVFCIMAIIGFTYALHVKEKGQHAAALVYVGSALGVTFAGDFLTLFIFWELLAFSSVFLVWYGKSDASLAAGFRYLLVHIFGGLCLLGGIVLHVSKTGSLGFEAMMPFSGGVAFYLILIGFILNAAVPPLGAWLPDAYPEATVTGAVFMTAFTTKSAVYVLLRSFAGTELLVWLGAIMAIYGVVFAVLENDARRLLAYHIVSQVGYMVCGVGIGTSLAVNGASSHAFAHILYKGLLFMGAGAVLEMTGKRKLSEMGGIYKTMPVTMILYMIGAFSISAFPLFSGFVSKSMVVSAAGEDHRPWILLMLTLASSGTFLHTGLKLPYYMFFGKDSGIRASEPPTNMLVAMAIASLLCLGIGVFPQTLYALLPFDVAYHPFSAQHVSSTMGLLLFTGLGFFVFLKHLDPEPTISIDTDWFYRKGAKIVMWLAHKPLVFLEYFVIGRVYEFLVQNPILRVARLLQTFDTFVVDGSVNHLGKGTRHAGKLLRTIQSGQIPHYAIIFVLGVLTLAFMVLFISSKG